MIFYTVCTLSHLFQARILAQSLRTAHPEAKLYVGLVDRLTPDVDLGPIDRSAVIEVEHLRIPGFAGMQSRYRIAELCFACKPYFGSHLMRECSDEGKFVYIDSDFYVFDRFDHLDAALNSAELVLTPHVCEPVHDGADLERIVLGAGAYNAGFFAFRRSASAVDFLSWFSERLEADCYGWAGDQVWLGLAPTLFPNVHIDRHPGMNMAAWNVRNRRLSVRGGKIECNGSPLVCYHYSGFDPRVPDRASGVPGLGADRGDRPDLWLALDAIGPLLLGGSMDPLRTRRSPFGRVDPPRRPAAAWVQAIRGIVRRTGFDVVRTSAK
jgi:hypothetical protein